MKASTLHSTEKKKTLSNFSSHQLADDQLSKIKGGIIEQDILVG